MEEIIVRILLLEDIDRVARQMFQKAGHEVVEIRHALAPGELAKYKADVIGVRSGTQVTEEVFRHHPRLVVAAYCIGTDKIDLQACENNGCVTFHDRYSNGRSVTELCMFYIGILLRQLLIKNRQTHEGIWDKRAKDAHEVRGKRLGIIGYGNIGQQVGSLAEAMGMKVGFFDLAERPALGNARKYSTMDKLLANSDVVTIHVDGRDGNRNRFGVAEIEKMRKRAYFINLSRGFVVHEDALAKAITSGHLAGAALDVHRNEPKNGEKFHSPLQGLDNVILTSHIGGSTREAQRAIGKGTTQRVLDYLDKGFVQLSPSFPQKSFTDSLLPGTARIIYIHWNEPGQIGAAGKVLANHQANIVNPRLLVNERIGFAVFDVQVLKTGGIVRDLEKLPGAIRARIL